MFEKERERVREREIERQNEREENNNSMQLHTVFNFEHLNFRVNNEIGCFNCKDVKYLKFLVIFKQLFKEKLK